MDAARADYAGAEAGVGGVRPPLLRRADDIEAEGGKRLRYLAAAARHDAGAAEVQEHQVGVPGEARVHGLVIGQPERRYT